MKIGFTYDLRDDYLKEGYTEDETAEFDRADTIDSIENCLKNMGHEVERIGNIKSLIRHLSLGNRWDLVFNIAEGMYGSAREAQIPSILDAFQIPYTFSDSYLLTVSLNKDVTKLLVREAGVPTPEFAVVKTLDDIKEINIPFPLFAKPLAEGTSKGISAKSVIYSLAELENVVESLLKTYNQPVLVEKFLPGREFTVGVVGTGEDARCVGVLEVTLNENAEKGVYSYENKENCEELVTYSLANDFFSKKCEEYTLKLWRELGFKDAGRMDFRLDENGEPNFIEVNPLAGLNPVHSDLPILCSIKGVSFQQLIEEIINSAIKRTSNEQTDFSNIA